MIQNKLHAKINLNAAYLLIALIDGSFSSLLVDDDRVPLVFELGLKLFGEEKETLRRCWFLSQPVAKFCRWADSDVPPSGQLGAGSWTVHLFFQTFYCHFSIRSLPFPFGDPCRQCPSLFKSLKIYRSTIKERFRPLHCTTASPSPSVGLRFGQCLVSGILSCSAESVKSLVDIFFHKTCFSDRVINILAVARMSDQQPCVSFPYYCSLS